MIREPLPTFPENEIAKKVSIKNLPGSGLLTGTTVVKVTFKNIKTAKTTAKKYRCVVKAAIEEKPETPVAALQAEQAGSSKITITSNTDIEADTITVKKGNTEVKVTSKEFTADGKSATLVLENKIVAADYTVAVSNAAVTASFKGELSKLASIEFTSDYAIVDGDFGTTNSAYTYYVALNQWKEDVTDSTSLTVTSSANTESALKGKVTFGYSSPITASQLNDPVTCVLYDSTSGVTAQKTLNITNKALVAEIEPYGENGIYNANRKTLAVADKYTEAFYYMFRAKDQYGNYLEDVTKMNQNDSGFFYSFSAGLTNMDLATLTTKVIDGVTYFAFPLVIDRPNGKDLEAGTATLILVAGGSGKSINADIAVASGNTVDKITVTAPSTVASGDVAKFDYVALDKEGNEVTSYAQLKKLTMNPAAASPDDYGFYWTKVNGKAVLYFNTKGVASPSTSMGTLLTGTFLTTTYNSSMVSFNVKQSRYPAEIVGLKDTAPTAQSVGRTLELNESDFKVVDQYGDAYSLGDHKNYGIQVTLKSGDAFGAISYSKATNAAGVPTCTDAISGDNASNKHLALKLYANKVGTSVYEFKICSTGGINAVNLYNTLDATTKNVTEESAKKISLSVSSSEKFVSYEVSGPDMLFVSNDQDINGATGDYGTPAEYLPSISVTATDNTGAKIKLQKGDFSISGGKFVKPNGADKIETSVNTADEYNKYFALADTVVDGSYVVTMNDGYVVEKSVKVSNSKPSIASLSYGTKTYISPASLDAQGILADISGKDNYGFDLLNTNGVLSFKGNTKATVYPASVKITVTDFVYAASHVTGNGTSDPRFYNVEKGDKFTVEVSGGSAAITIAVVPKDTVYDNTNTLTDVIMTKIADGNGNTITAKELSAAGVKYVVDAYETSAYQATLGAITAASKVDTLPKLQAIINDANAEAFASETANNMTVASFAAIGITGVTNDNVAVVTGTSLTAATTHADLQAAVDKAIKAYNVLSSVAVSITTGDAIVRVANNSAETVSVSAISANNVVSTAAITNVDTNKNLAAGKTAVITLKDGTNDTITANSADTFTISFGGYEVTVSIEADTAALDHADVTPKTITSADISES